MAAKSGIVELTILTEHMCRTWNKYAAKTIVVVNAAAAAGTITAAQQTSIIATLNNLSATCAIFKLISGY